MSREILDCLKRERDICVKNVIHSQNTAFMYTPALIIHFYSKSHMKMLAKTGPKGEPMATSSGPGCSKPD